MSSYYQERFNKPPDAMLPVHFKERFNIDMPWNVTLAPAKHHIFRHRCTGYDLDGKPTECYVGFSQAGFLLHWRRLYYTIKSHKEQTSYTWQTKKAFAYLGITYYCKGRIGKRCKGYTKAVIDNHYRKVYKIIEEDASLDDMMEAAAKLWDKMTRRSKERFKIQKKPLSYNPLSLREPNA